ncbi:hypothetical protein KAX02_04840 [candidate division WOR-3 bacterium]|nr:hypothetical protein [candidate division WOR-3 bacterium]
MRQRKKEFLYEELTYKIIGIGMKIYRELSPSFLETQIALVLSDFTD